MDKKVSKVNTVYKGGGDAVYGFGLIGALIFYVQQAQGFGAVLLAFLKSFVWPAFVVYDLLHLITR